MGLNRSFGDGEGVKRSSDSNRQRLRLRLGFAGVGVGLVAVTLVVGEFIVVVRGIEFCMAFLAEAVG